MSDCEQYVAVTTRDRSVGSPKKRIIFIIILFVFAFMQCIYNYVPETNLVSRIHCFAAILYFQFMVHIMLFSHVRCFVLLHNYFPWYVFSAQNGFFFVVP